MSYRPSTPELAVTHQGKTVFHSTKRWPSVFWYTMDPTGKREAMEFDIRTSTFWDEEMIHAEILKTQIEFQLGCEERAVEQS